MMSRSVPAMAVTGLSVLIGLAACAELQGGDELIESQIEGDSDRSELEAETATAADELGGAPRGWRTTWGTAPQALGDNQLANVSLREIVHVSVGGRQVRVRLDNTFGDGPVAFSNVRVALQDTGAAVRPDTDRALTFGGATSVTVAQGALALSDPVQLDVPAQSDLAVSMFLPGTVQQLTGHASASQTSYVSIPGDHAGEPGGESFTTPIFEWYWLNGVDVLSRSTRGAIVALGDSITNGSNSAFGANHRWPDILAGRLLASGASRAMVNKGIGGAQLLTRRSDCCPTAEAGLARLDRDVIGQAGVTHAIVLLGVNDIGFGRDAPSLIAGFRQLIAQLHAKEIAVVGATILPFGGSIVDNPANEATRQAVNAWIRSARAFDGVIDFDRAVRDPAVPTRLLPAFDSGDHLHPSDAGHVAMGNAVRLSLFR